MQEGYPSPVGQIGMEPDVVHPWAQTDRKVGSRTSVDESERTD
jgi:hypothetical protein